MGFRVAVAAVLHLLSLPLIKHILKEFLTLPNILLKYSIPLVAELQTAAPGIVKGLRTVHFRGHFHLLKMNKAFSMLSIRDANSSGN